MDRGRLYALMKDKSLLCIHGASFRGKPVLKYFSACSGSDVAVQVHLEFLAQVFLK